MNRTYISGGMIYDGTGGDPFFGDIVINGGKIEEVLPHRTDRFTGTEGPLIHAEGLAVTPGPVRRQLKSGNVPFPGTLPRKASCGRKLSGFCLLPERIACEEAAAAYGGNGGNRRGTDCGKGIRTEQFF